MKKDFENNSLLVEFLEVIDVDIFSYEEEKKIIALFEAMYPLTKWGKLDWDLIKIKKEIHNIEEITSTLHEILLISIDYSVYILCDDATIPILKVNLEDVVKHFNKMERILMYKFIFNPMQGYIMEVPFSGKVTIGLVEKERIGLCIHLKKFLEVLPIKRFHNKHQDEDIRWMRKLLNPFVQSKYWNISASYVLSHQEIIPFIEGSLKQSIEKDILLMWEDKQFPIIETDLEKVIFLWNILIQMGISFQIIAMNSSYSIKVDSKNEIKIIINYGLKFK